MKKVNRKVWRRNYFKDDTVLVFYYVILNSFCWKYRQVSYQIQELVILDLRLNGSLFQRYLWPSY